MTILTLEEYQALTSVHGKEEIILRLPARDLFSDELKVYIQNTDLPVGSFPHRLGKRQAEIRVYSSTEGVELTRQVMQDEFVIITAQCGAFFVAYTYAPRSQLYVFNARTSMMIKNGLFIEGACFIDANEECMSFAILTLKGSLQVYTVCNLGEALLSSTSLLDACRLDYTATGLSDIIKSKANPSCTVKYMKLLRDGSVLVFLSENFGVYEYDQRVRVWRQSMINGGLELQNQLKQGSNPSREAQGSSALRDLSSVIQQLENQSIDSKDADMLSQGHSRTEQVNLAVRANELQEQMQLYERL